MTHRCASALAAVLAICAVGAAQAGGRTALEAAVQAGGEQLTADEIAARIEGNTVRFAFADNDRVVLVHYGPDNRLAGKMIEGGEWSGAGIYGVADTDRVCLSWKGLDAGRLRCLTVLIVNGEMRKYRADGSLMGAVKAVSDGRIF
jgi:hypothetical protein